MDTVFKISVEEHGGMLGLRDPGALESAIAQPRGTFGDEDLHPHISRGVTRLDTGTKLIASHVIAALPSRIASITFF